MPLTPLAMSISPLAGQLPYAPQPEQAAVAPALGSIQALPHRPAPAGSFMRTLTRSVGSSAVGCQENPARRVRRRAEVMLPAAARAVMRRAPPETPTLAGAAVYHCSSALPQPLPQSSCGERRGGWANGRRHMACRLCCFHACAAERH